MTTWTCFGGSGSKLDLQRSLFGRYLYFEPKTVDPFLNQKNTLLSERLRLHFEEGTADTYIPEGWVGESESESEELRQVGVTSLPLFEPSVFDRALSFKRFLKRFSASGRV